MMKIAYLHSVSGGTTVPRQVEQRHRYHLFPKPFGPFPASCNFVMNKARKSEFWLFLVKLRLPIIKFWWFSFSIQNYVYHDEICIFHSVFKNTSTMMKYTFLLNKRYIQMNHRLTWIGQAIETLFMSSLKIQNTHSARHNNIYK